MIHKQVTDNDAHPTLKISSICGAVHKGDSVTMTVSEVDCESCKRLLAHKSAGDA